MHIKKTSLNYLLTASYFLALSIAAPFWQWIDNLAIFDLNYFVANSNRISMGEIPYKDFILVLPPTTYLIQASIFKVFGNNIFSIIIPSIIMNFITSFFLFNHLITNKITKKISILISSLYVLCSGFTLFPWLHYDNFIFLIILIYLIRYFYHKQNIYLDCLLLIICITTKQNIGIVFFTLIFLFDLYYLNRKVLLKKIFILTFYFTIIIFLMLYYSITLKEIVNQLFLVPFKFRVNEDCLLNISTLIPNVFTERNFPRFILSTFMTVAFIALIQFKRYFKNKYLFHVTVGLASYIFIIHFHYGFTWYILLLINIYLFTINFPKLNPKNIFLLIIILTSISGFLSGGPTGGSFGTILLMIFVYLKSIEITKIPFLKNTNIKIFFIFLILSSAIFQNFFNDRMRFNNSSRFSKIELVFSGFKKQNTYNYYIKELLKAKELEKYSNETAVNIPGEDAMFHLSNFSNPLNYNQIYPPTTGYNNDDLLKDIYKKNPKLLFIKISKEQKYSIIRNHQLSDKELNKKGYYLILEKYGYKVYEKK